MSLIKVHCTGWLLQQIVAQLPRVHSGGRLHQGQDIDNSARWLKNMYDDNEKKDIFSDLEVCQLKYGKSRINVATPQANVNNF